MNRTAYITFKFLTELLLSTLLYVLPLKRRGRFVLRLVVSIGLCYLLSYLTSPITLRFHTWGQLWYALTSIARYLLLYGAVTASVYACFVVTPQVAVFASAGAYAIQHITLHLQNLAEYFYGDSVTMIGKIVLYILFVLMAYVLFYGILHKRLQNVASISLRSEEIWLFSLLAIGSMIVISVLASISERDLFAEIGYAGYGVICGTFLLSMQFDIFQKATLRQENERIETILEQERRQFDSFREGVEYLDIKCHDLKHQIHRLKDGKAVSDETIAEIEDGIARYEAYADTGNAALDMVIAEKFLRCAGAKIAFTPVVKGTKLSALSDSDIYSLFGNALDNAIEYEQTRPETERFIRLNVNEMGDMLFIRIENGYAGEPTEDVASLSTTKEDKHYHGFGLKSMAKIAEKYGGTMDLKARDGVFALTFVFTVRDRK